MRTTPSFGLNSGLLSAVGWGFLASEVVLALGYGYVSVCLARAKRNQ